MSEWENVGCVGVDAGLMWVGDPCYILHRTGERRYKNLGENWSDFCNKLGEKYPTIQQFNYDHGNPGLGMAISTGYGDGTYEVYVKRHGKRIAEVKVVFIEDKQNND